MSKKYQYRLHLSVTPEIKDALKALADRWNCKTNEAATRAILDCLHRPLATAPEPPWAKEIKKDLNILKNQIEINFS